MRKEDKANKKCPTRGRTFFFAGILRKEGRPQELSFLRMPEHLPGCRKNRSCKFRFHLHHCYFGFPIIELTILSGLKKHPACHLFSGMCADQACLPHKPVYPFLNRERSLFCPSSKHSPPTLFFPSVSPVRRGISPYVPH